MSAITFTYSGQDNIGAVSGFSGVMKWVRVYYKELTIEEIIIFYNE